jgi:hypothetical protein
MTAMQASELLDRVLDQQLLDVVDLEGLLGMQRQLFDSLCLCGVDTEQATERSGAMVRDALSRLANDFVEDACPEANIVATPD